MFAETFAPPGLLAALGVALALGLLVGLEREWSKSRVAGIRNSVLCGVVQRALDPARPDGPKIDIHYVVAPAMARRKLPDPVFVLAGGPGQSATQIAPTLLALLSRLNNRRDIVFVDATGVRPLIDKIFSLSELGSLAADVVARAIARGVYEA